LTQAQLAFTGVVPKPTGTLGRVYALLAAHRGEWIDGRRLAEVGGYAAWSSRCRDLRKPPFNMTVEQRDYPVERDGRKFTVTEYRLI
jgi:hypothetical protein